MERCMYISWKDSKRDLSFLSGVPRHSVQLNSVMLNPEHECHLRLSKMAALFFFFNQISIRIAYLTSYCVSRWASPEAQMVKNPPANRGDPSSIPGLGRVPWRRKWQPTPVFLPGEAHGQRSLEGYSPWGHKGSDTTEAT